jgi:hypothetical protein
MHKQLTIPIVLAMALLALVLPTTAWAADVFKFKGQSADAFFASVDASGCIVTNVFVFASDDAIHNPPGSGNSSSATSLYISQYNSCTNTQLLGASGYATLADPDFQVQKLDSATLNATVNVFDFVSNTSFNVSISLAWTATGPTSRQNSHFHFQSPGCTVNGQSNGTFRTASASGSVSDGATNFISAPSNGADLSLVKNGNITVGCGI